MIFDLADKTPGFTLEAVISDQLWRELFEAIRQILGRSLRLDNDLYRITGVMPPSFHDPLRTTQQRNTQIWLASGFSAPPAPPPLRSSRFIPEAIARLKPELTLEPRKAALMCSSRLCENNSRPITQ